jgi:hypothetical protein
MVDAGGRPAVDSAGSGLDSGGGLPDSSGPTPGGDSGGASDSAAGSDGSGSGPDAAQARDGASDGSVGQSGCTGVVAAFCDDFEMQTTAAPPQGMFSVNTGGRATMMVETT